MTRPILFVACLFISRTTPAQERSFSFGVGPAFTYGLTRQTNGPAANGYSTHFNFTQTSKEGVLKGLCLDLTEISTIYFGDLQLNNETFRIRQRRNYGHPAIAIAFNLGKEIKTKHSSFSYYGSVGPVCAFQANGSIGAIVGAAAKYYYHFDEKIAIGAELSPRCYYIRMFNPSLNYDANAVFATLPLTFNFRFSLPQNKKQDREVDKLQAD